MLKTYSESNGIFVKLVRFNHGVKCTNCVQHDGHGFANLYSAFDIFYDWKAKFDYNTYAFQHVHAHEARFFLNPLVLSSLSTLSKAVFADF